MEDGAQPGFLSVGQAAARRIAQRAAEGGRLHRTLLVHGPRGSGVDGFLDDLLALLLCNAPELVARPCNACDGCRGARNRSHPDLVIGSPARWREMRSSGESIVGAARRWLGDSAGAPIVADRRILVIEDVDAANEQIQNALLKALEEPGPRQMFVLVAHDLTALLPTVRSRCQPLRIGPVARDELAAWLMDRRALPADAADDLARLAGGLSGLAAQMADDSQLITWRRRTQAELLGLLTRGMADRLAVARELLDEAGRRAPQRTAAADESLDDPGGAPTQTPAAQTRAAAILLVEAWRDLARDLLVIASDRPDLAHGADLVDGAADAARRAGPGPLARFLHVLRRVHDGLLDNSAPKLATEVAMLAWPRLA